MIIPNNGKLGWYSGDVFSPSDLSEYYENLKDAGVDVISQRAARTPITYQMVLDPNTPLTNSDYSTNAERCRARFRAPTICNVEIERIFCSANYSATDTIDGYLLLANGTTPSGIFNPVFTLPAVSAVADLPSEGLSLQPLTCTSAMGDVYLELRPRSGTFSFERCDLTFHIKTDKYGFTIFSDLATTDDIQFTEVDTPNATRINTINNSLNDISFHPTDDRASAMPILMQFTNFTNATSSVFLTAPFPAAKTPKTLTLMEGAAFALWTGNTTATVQFLIKDQTGSTKETMTAPVVAASFKSGTQVSFFFDTAVATTGPLAFANDWSVVCSESSGSATIFKAYMLIWVK